MKNIAGMLQKAQALQAKMSEMQAELKTREIVGSSGQGKVKVTMNGGQDVVKISIDPEVVNPDEADLLEDLVLAAFNDARAKVTRMVEEEMGKLTGGMGLPKGLF
ncbi:MAG: YbaB/EbfC family nucleoid-associated protein [Candidatus Eisenbacteria bacterium]|uniref:Nucleoid-associated protein E6K75_00410 n=1 Tax=Eiseniibacteriota bacterium TaxID=2212470 RepID=A0A538TEG7_UNCEI|nr:MAG: YbaB/EbfC family nucleoid-associated protein [Candidatus Eisenbacteria bacterium]